MPSPAKLAQDTPAEVAPATPASAAVACAPSTEPLFMKVRNKLRDDILAKRLPPGEKLPSEAKLQAAFNVSRITVRQALSELQAEGLVETFNGKGSFVTRPANAPLLGLLAGFNAVMESRGLRTGGQLLSVATGTVKPLVARALGVARDATVLTITTLRIVDDEPAAYAFVVCEPELGRKLIDLGVETQDVMTLLEEKLELRLERTHIEASAVAANRMHAALLRMAPGTPLLRMRFVPYDMAGRPLLFAEVYFHPDKFSYRAVIRR